jgi:PKD repeat protein
MRAELFDHPPVASFTAAPTTPEEGASVTFDASGSGDPDGDALTYAWDFGDGTTGTGMNPSHVYADDGSYAVSLTVADPAAATNTAVLNVPVANVAPALSPVSAPTAPLALGSSASVTATFTDQGILDTHTGAIAWGDGTASPATVTEANGSGALAGSHTYTSPGVYEVAVTVDDDDGGTATALFQFVVVFDPASGFVTGGGWIDSPAGACRLVGCTDATVGKATFGFVSRYQKGATTPSGNTEFQFKDGGLRFTSDSYQWLVVSGPMAQYKGTGRVNGTAGYGFLLTARDGDLPGGGGVDRFRIKIWEASGTVVYDNQMGKTDNGGATTALGGGQIQIHR